MNGYVLLMNGMIRTKTKSILLWTRDRLSSWWKNTALGLIRAGLKFEYRFAAGVAMYALRRRWQDLLDLFPARRRLRELEQDYWHMYDEWTKLDYEYRLLYAKHMDLNDEIRYWETRHAKILNYIEKKMELDDTWGK